MNRREAVIALACVGMPFGRALAQSGKRVRRIGVFTAGSLQGTEARLGEFRQGMKERGWIEARDYTIDARYGDKGVQAWSALTAELVATKPDLLLTTGDAATRLLIQRTRKIPIVFAIAQDPVGNRLVASLQQPGGNVTGLTTLSGDLAGKQLQLLKEAFPGIGQVALLYEPENAGSVSQARQMGEAAPRLGMRIKRVGIRGPADLEAAFGEGSAAGAQAYILAQGGVVSAQRRVIAERLVGLKLPSIAANTDYAESGALISYAASSRENFHRAAGYVDRIFKGAKPAELPVEQPTKFELVLNLKTARAIGKSFAQSFLLRADRVIE